MYTRIYPALFRSTGHSRRRLWSRSLATVASTSTAPKSSRAQKAEGDIQEFFSTLDPDVSHNLPSRFADLKAEIWHDGLLQSWKEVLVELETETERIAHLGTKVRWSSRFPSIIWTLG